jgi:hypothetical protein
LIHWQCVLAAKRLPLFVVTSQKEEADKIIQRPGKTLLFLFVDGTVIKTAGKSKPDLFYYAAGKYKREV